MRGALLSLFICCACCGVTPSCGEGWTPYAAGDGDAGDGDGDGDADGDGDGDVDADDGRDSEAALARLVVRERWEIPAFGTGVDSVFSDVYLSPEPRIYLVNDREQCEVAVVAGAPDFSGSAGTFCALTPGFVLRGWTTHESQDHIVDAEGRQIVSGTGERWPLPDSIVEPTGLASDGEALWVADGRRRVLTRVTPGGDDVRSLSCPGDQTRSVSWDGSLLWVLDEDRVRLIGRDGVVRSVYELELDLSGLTIREGRIFGVARDASTIYRLDVES